MRRAARIDANQNRVVDYLRSAGWFVYVTSGLGRGFPDLCCARPGFTCLVELKDGDKPASKQELTEPERKFREAYSGPYVVGFTPEQTLAELNARYLQKVL